jgi:hypothetical protein
MHVIRAMLALLAILNLANFILWLQWGIRMHSRNQRLNWVMKKWGMNAYTYGLFDTELDINMKRNFAQRFKLGHLLYFYYIEWHTGRRVASAFCMALFHKW